MFETREEWEQVVNEYKFGLKRLSIVTWNGEYTLKIELLEGTPCSISFRNGFQISVLDPKINGTIFESMDSLLDTCSPKYREAFQNKLAQKLEALDANDE